MLILLYIFFFRDCQYHAYFVCAFYLQEGYIGSQFLLAVKCIKPADFNASQICNAA